MTDALEVISSEETHEDRTIINHVDVDLEVQGILAYYKDIIAAGRDLPIMSTYFIREAERILQITSRGFVDEADKTRAIKEILYTFPGLLADTMVLAYPGMVTYDTGERASLIIQVLTLSGLYTEVFPYDVVDGETCYDGDANLNSIPQSDEIKHALAVYAFAMAVPGEPDDVLMWLSSMGHTIQFAEGFDFSNLNIKVGK